MLKFRQFLNVILALILFGLTPHAAAKSGSTEIVGDEIEIMSASGEHFSKYSGANVLDGDLSNQSVFASRLNPADLFLDLGEVWTVESLKLAWEAGPSEHMNLKLRRGRLKMRHGQRFFMGIVRARQQNLNPML